MGLIAFAQGKWAGLNVLAEHRGKRIRPMTYTAMDGIRLTKGYAAVQIKFGRRPVMQITGWAGSLFWYVGALLNIETWGRRWQLITDWLVTGFLPRDTTSMLIAQHRAVLPMRFEDGEIILREQEAGSRCYIITAGSVEILHRRSGDEEEIVARMAHGQIFGTDVLQGDGRRTATVRAVGEVRLLGIAREELQPCSPTCLACGEIWNYLQMRKHTLSVSQRSTQPCLSNSSQNCAPTDPQRQSGGNSAFGAPESPRRAYWMSILFCW